MRDDHARRFLTERGVSWEARQAQERMARLEAAYSRLVEHEGQPPSIRQLSKVAQVSDRHARRFLLEQQSQEKGTQA